ncbi:MAG: lanthionine synthetase LanC family protein, partial [Candidatus Kariarchaeaceae archaeon]
MEVVDANNITLTNNFNATEFVNLIIDSLYQEARFDENDSLIGWILLKNTTREYDEFVFRGYQWGVAGIGDFLLDAYLAGYTDASSLMDDSITHLVENIVEDGDEGYYWPRIAIIRSDGWPGHRYGNAGIAKFLARVQAENSSLDLQTIIEEAFVWVKNQQNEDGIPIQDRGTYITTGIEYGAAGIGSSLLEVYKNLQISTYLSFAEDMANWIIQVGAWKDDRFRVIWTPYGDNTEFDGFHATGLSVGMAGIMDFMLDLFETTSNSTYKEVAIGMANDLLVTDQGGYWYDGAVSYITKYVHGNSGLVGYNVGSTGIAEQLLRIYDLTSDQQLLESSARVEKFVEHFSHEDGSISAGIINDVVKPTGLGLGSAGIAEYYLNLYERFKNDRHLEVSTRILTHLYDLYIQYGLIPVDENDLEIGYSFDIERGLAGIGKVLLHYEQVI